MRAFLFALFVAAFLIVVATYVLAGMDSIRLPTMLWPTVLFTLICTSVIFRRVQEASREKFIPTYLLSIVIKVLVSLVYCTTVMLVDIQGAVPNVLLFLILYIVFTALEVLFLFRGRRR